MSDVQATSDAGLDPTATTDHVPMTDTTPVDSAAVAGKIEELPEWAQALVKDLRKESAAHRTAKKQAEEAARVAAEQQLADEKKWQELAEARGQKLADLEATVKARDLDDLRRKVATDAGLPAELAGRLQGETEAELRADADTLKKALPKAEPRLGTPSARPGGRSAGTPTVEAVRRPTVRL